MRTEIDDGDSLGMVDAASAGRWFTEALTEGLARATAQRGRTPADRLPAGRTAPAGGRGSGTEPATPFSAAVLTAFEASLSHALTTAERRDSTLRSALSHEARRVLLGTLDAGRDTAGRSARGGRHPELSARHKALVSALVLECLVLVLAETPSPADAPVHLHSLARELGTSTRAALTHNNPF